jgi:carbon monoxide dehydrogenase subunit G
LRVRGEIVVAAPLDVTWAALADISSHVDWMADAETITFASAQHRGAGTTFECRTKVGPLTTVDRMTVTEWVEGARLGVAHSGIVTGTGVFELVAEGADSTRMTWTEALRFPIFLGGVVGAFVAKPVLRRVWRGNLRRFAHLVEGHYRPQ